LVKNQIVVKNAILVKNKILLKKQNFSQKSKFWSNIEISVKNSNFAKKKSKFCSKVPYTKPDFRS